MKAYCNLKMKTKLMLSFMLVGAFMLIVGAIGTVSISLIQQEDEEMYAENTKPMEDLATMYDTLASQRICAANIVLFHTADAEFAAAETTSLAEKEAMFEEAFAAYKATINLPEEQQLSDVIDQLYFGEYAAIKADFRAAVESGDEAAMAGQVKRIDDMGTEISAHMDDSFALNVREAEQKVAANGSLATMAGIVQLAAIVVGLLFAAFCAFFLSGLIVRPLIRIMQATKQVGETGSLKFSQEVIGQIQQDAAMKDETGQTALAFANMMEALIAKSEVLEQVAGGDLSVTVDKASEEDTLGNAMEHMVNHLNEMFGEVNASTDQVSAASSQIATGAQSLAQATTEQSAAVQQLLASVNQVADQTRENASRAEQAAQLAGSIKQNAQQGADQMHRMTQAVEEINAASQSISAVIKVIDDIAFQTNILALNAAVEAARAGQHGKGFAVVADEVRSLAGKSAEAAKDTGNLIADTVEKAELGAKIAQQTSQSLDTIVEGINESTTVVSEIAAASEQQSLSIEEINKGIDQVSQVVQQNSATAEESAAAAEEMSSQAAVLKSMVDRFQLRTTAYGSQLPPARVHAALPVSMD